MKTKLQEIPIKALINAPENERKIDLKDPALIEMAESIRRQGVLQPLVVRPHPKSKDKFEVRAGARRLAAADLAGLETVPCLVRDLGDQAALETTVAENLHRKDLTPLEEAANIAAVLDAGWSIDSVAQDLGKSSSWVARRAQLAKLSPRWRKHVLDTGNLISGWSASRLELIARLDIELQDSILKERSEYGFRNWFFNPDRPLKELEEELNTYTNMLGKAPWKLDDKDLNGKACLGCSNRSSSRPGLFDEINLDDPKEVRRDRCLDPKCWKKKLEIVVRAKFREMKKDHKEVLAISSFRGENLVPEIKDKDITSEFLIKRTKKSHPKAVPVFNVSNGSVGWGTLERTSTVCKPKKKADAKAEPGDPAFRQLTADSYARAQVAFEIGTNIVDDPDMLGKALLASIVSEISGTRARLGADKWLQGLLGLVKDLDPRTMTQEAYWKEAVDSLGDVKDQLGGKTYAACILEATTLMLYRNLEENHVPGLGHPKFYDEAAAKVFRIPRLFLAAHRKSDLMVIAKDLGVKVKGTAKKGEVEKAIIDADLPAGSLTKELAAAFGIEQKMGTPEPDKKTKGKKKLVAKRTAKNPRTKS